MWAVSNTLMTYLHVLKKLMLSVIQPMVVVVLVTSVSDACTAWQQMQHVKFWQINANLVPSINT